jgi:hypothetical protein
MLGYTPRPDPMPCCAPARWPGARSGAGYANRERNTTVKNSAPHAPAGAAPNRLSVAAASPPGPGAGDATHAHGAAVTDTYLLGMGEMAEPAALSSLRVGARLELRRARVKAARGRGRIEVRWPDGRALGYLPPEDARPVEDLWDAGAAASVRVTALVPAFQRPRVLLRIEPGAAAPAADAD